MTEKDKGVAESTASPTVSIALCSFNGARYLRQQLDSIAAQSRRPDEIVVCDDGSDDETISITCDFAKDAPFPVRIEINERRLGTVANFDKAIGLCRGDIVFLSDQDDVWHPRKIEKQIAAMRSMEARHGRDTPLLVHSDLEVAGPTLDRIAPSYMKYQGIRHLDDDFGSLLVQNFVTGCATAVNRALIDLARPIPEVSLMHDWWLALCAAAGGRIGFIAEPLVAYRQHGGNQVGSKNLLRQYSPFRQNYREHWRMTQEALARAMKQAGSLRDRLVERGATGADILAAADAYARIPQQSPLRRLTTLRRHGLRRQNRHFNAWMNVKIAIM